MEKASPFRLSGAQVRFVLGVMFRGYFQGTLVDIKSGKCPPLFSAGSDSKLAETAPGGKKIKKDKLVCVCVCVSV